MSEQPQPGYIPQFDIADRLRKAREHTGLDQDSFAGEIAVSRSTVGNYESSDYPRKRQAIVLKAWALRSGVPLEWIETGTVATKNGPRPGLDQDEDRLSRPRSDSNGQPTGSTSAQVIRLSDYRRSA